MKFILKVRSEASAIPFVEFRMIYEYNYIGRIYELMDNIYNWVW